MLYRLIDSNDQPVLINGAPKIVQANVMPPAPTGKGWHWEEYVPPVEPDPPVIVPDGVTNAQMRGALAMLAGDHIAEVTAFIAGIPDDTQRRLATIAWEYANYVERNSALVEAFRQYKQWTTEFVDQLFVTAGSIAY